MKKYPPFPDNKGKRKSLINISGKRRYFTILGEIKRAQSNAPHKVIYLQRMLWEDNNEIQLRLAYYIIGKKPKMRGKWVFGQFATIMTVKDFRFIFRTAKRKGWI